MLFYSPCRVMLIYKGDRSSSEADVRKDGVAGPAIHADLALLKGYSFFMSLI